MSEQEPTVEAYERWAEILEKRFIQRYDWQGRQTGRGYRAVNERLRRSDVMAHLRGHMTLGAYVLDEESRGGYVVFDADDAAEWRCLQAMAKWLADEGAVGYLEGSRRGGHLWYFVAERQTGRALQAFGQGLVAFFRLEGIELFPKQAELKDGPGSMIRLPFGIHRKSLRRYGFYWPDGTLLAPTLREQIPFFEEPETVPMAVWERFVAHAPKQKRRLERGEAWEGGRGVLGEGATDGERIRAAISVRDFVLQFVELSPSGKGLCPFHDDHVPSFSVNDRENYWYCFACEMGGDVIKFLMAWEECDYGTAVEMLKEREAEGRL
ncbi:MAG TPA: CHC2 zinc finger domain-containing protein [Anaerolineae bacterium]|nr:CHC2 zinc finger domain-containing protein [Anaerolineae bacterium]